MSKDRKLIRTIEGTVVTITEFVTKKEMKFDFAKLPKEIQEKLGPFGLNHKLGDSAAGATGQEAVDSIMQVWDGLMKADWRVKTAAGEKVSINAVNSGLEKLPPKEQEAARALLIKLGIIKDPSKVEVAPAAPGVAPVK
jgi:hypothetical protein